MWPLGLVAGLIAAGLLYQEVGVRRQRRRFPPPGQLLDVGGHRLHVSCSGTGRPVVLFESGIAASSLSWAVVQKEVAGFTRACAYDRAGLAWSDPPSCPRSFTAIVDDLEAVLEHAAAGDRSILVGHSFGSFVVRAYAARHPERVAGLVLVDPPTEWLTMTDERAYLLWGATRLSKLGAVLARVGVVRACLALLTGGAPGAPSRFVRLFGPRTARTLERLVGEVRKLPPEVHPQVQALWCQPKCFRAMADHLQTLFREGAKLVALRPPPEVPVIVISSGGQPPEEMEAHRALADGAADGRHVVVPRSAHWVQFDEPQLIVSTVRELVEAERRARASAR